MILALVDLAAATCGVDVHIEPGAGEWVIEVVPATGPARTVRVSAPKTPEEQLAVVALVESLSAEIELPMAGPPAPPPPAPRPPPSPPPTPSPTPTLPTPRPAPHPPPVARPAPPTIDSAAAPRADRGAADSGPGDPARADGGPGRTSAPARCGAVGSGGRARGSGRDRAGVARLGRGRGGPAPGLVRRPRVRGRRRVRPVRVVRRAADRGAPDPGPPMSRRGPRWPRRWWAARLAGRRRRRGW